MGTAVFLNQKRANVCEHMTKIHSSLNPLVAPFINSLVMPSLSCAHIHLLFSDWERLPCPSKYLAQVSMCLHVPVLLWILQFLVRVFTFLSLILCYSYFSTLLSTWSKYLLKLYYMLSLRKRAWSLKGGPHNWFACKKWTYSNNKSMNQSDKRILGINTYENENFCLWFMNLQHTKHCN